MKGKHIFLGLVGVLLLTSGCMLMMAGHGGQMHHEGMVHDSSMQGTQDTVHPKALHDSTKMQMK